MQQPFVLNTFFPTAPGMTPKLFPTNAFPVGVYFKQLEHTQSKIRKKNFLKKEQLGTLFKVYEWSHRNSDVRWAQKSNNIYKNIMVVHLSLEK